MLAYIPYMDPMGMFMCGVSDISKKCLTRFPMPGLFYLHRATGSSALWPSPEVITDNDIYI